MVKSLHTCCRQFGPIRGFLERNVPGCPAERGLPTSVEDDQLQAEVASATAEVLSTQDGHVRSPALASSRSVDSWNAHRVPGRGIPNVLASGGCPVKIPGTLLPCSSVAADLVQRNIHPRVSGFGVHPFMTDEARQQAGRRFSEAFGDITPPLDGIANDNPTPFLEALQHLVRVSE